MYVICYDENTFGTTKRSLKMLRDTLAKRIDHRIAVVQVPSNQICCGFLVLDVDAQEAIFTGDGFRTDNGGEGGAGYKSAKALLDLFGMQPICWAGILNIWDPYAPEEIRRSLVRLVDQLQRCLNADCYIKPTDRAPAYLP